MQYLERLRRKSEAIADYLSRASEMTPAFSRQFEEYDLDGEIIEELKEYVDEVVMIVFSAEWCPDCFRNVPILGLVAESTGIEVMVFGHLMRNTENPNEIWRIPPSPVEVKKFHVTKIPLIIVLTKKGEKIGEIVETPPEGTSLEKALLDILTKA